MYIKRHIETVVTELLSQYPCMLISGPRQVGKTTLIQNLHEDKQREYITLDDMALRTAAKADPKTFLQDHKPPICIDEIQYAPELFPYIKMIVDKTHRPGDFILTGSQIYRLMRNVRESLAGRIVLLNMQGFSLSEITGLPNLQFIPDRDAYIARNQKEPLDSPAVFKRIYTGGMPELVSGAHSDPARFYSSYIATYLARDIRDIAQIDEPKFFRFLTAAAARTAQILNVADIARDAEISVPVANSWLNILETLGIIYYLYPYHNNLLKRTIKKPKLYFYDTGLACHLARWISAEALMNGAQNGAMFETFAVSEIMKSCFNAGRDPYVYYYRDIDMREIDLIIEQNQMLHPVEIKKTAHVDRRIAGTFKLIERSGLKQGMGAVICMNDRLGSINEDTLTIPITSI